jgi:hypothetical protein
LNQQNRKIMKVEIQNFTGTQKEFELEIVYSQGVIEAFSAKAEYSYGYDLATDTPEFIFESIQGAKWNGITGIYFPYVFSEEECNAIEAQMRDQIDWEEIIDVLNNWNNRD